MTVKEFITTKINKYCSKGFKITDNHVGVLKEDSMEVLEWVPVDKALDREISRVELGIEPNSFDVYIF